MSILEQIVMWDQGDCPDHELPPYVIRMVHLDEILIEPFQRPLNDRFISTRTGPGFNPELLLPIQLVELDDPIPPLRYSATEGQHRISIARENGRSYVCALVFEARSYEERAAQWLDVNTQRRAPNPVEHHVASLAKGDVRAAAIAAAAHAAGLEVVDSRGPRKIRAVGAVRRVYAASRSIDPGRCLGRAFKVIVAAGWAEETIHQDGILAVGMLIAKFGDAVDDAHLINVLKRVGRGGLQDQMRRQKGIAHAGGANDDRAREAMRQLYNRGLTRKRQLVVR